MQCFKNRRRKTHEQLRTGPTIFPRFAYENDNTVSSNRKPNEIYRAVEELFLFSFSLEPLELSVLPPKPQKINKRFYSKAVSLLRT